MNYYLGFKLGWFPNGGYVEFTEDPVDWLYHLILPWTALAILFIGFYSRVLRSNVLDTINEDYVRTARAKGLSAAPDHGQARASQLDDPDHHARGASISALSRRAGRSLRRPCSTCRAWASTRPRRSASSTSRRCSRSPCSRPSSSCCSTLSWTSCTPIWIRGSGCSDHPRGNHRTASAGGGRSAALGARPAGGVRHRGGRRTGGRRALVRPGRRRDPGGGGGVGLGKVRLGHDSDGPDALAEREVRGHRPLQGDRADHRAGGRAAPRARRGDRDDLPGPDDLAQPGAAHRGPDHRADPGARGPARPAGARAHDRADGEGRDPARPRPARLLPTRVLGRHAPARGDRPRAVLQPLGPDRRRAHDRTRRNDSGADPRAHPRAARRDRRRRDPGHARPRRGRRHRRSHRRHVLRANRGAGHARRDLLRPSAPLHLGPARVDHSRRPAAPGTAAGHRRPAALAVRPARGLPLPAALPSRVREMHARSRCSRRACRASPSTSTVAGSRPSRRPSCGRSVPARSDWIPRRARR